MHTGCAGCRCCPQAPTPQAPASSALAEGVLPLTAPAALEQVAAGGRAVDPRAVAAHLACAARAASHTGSSLGLEAARAPEVDLPCPATRSHQAPQCLGVASAPHHPPLQGGHPGRSPLHVAPPTTQYAEGRLAAASRQPQLPRLPVASAHQGG
jgi:hypothetical protein